MLRTDAVFGSTQSPDRTSHPNGFRARPFRSLVASFVCLSVCLFVCGFACLFVCSLGCFFLVLVCDKGTQGCSWGTRGVLRRCSQGSWLQGLRPIATWAAAAVLLLAVAAWAGGRCC